MIGKIELHCHLDGVLDLAMARAIRASNPEFPVDPDVFARAYPVDSFERFVDWWRFPLALFGDIDRFRPVLREHIRRLIAQDVIYTELMIGGSEIPRDTAEALDKLGALREWVEAEAGGRIQMECLACFGRNKPPEWLESMVPRNIALHEAGLIAGVALAGPEDRYPVRPHHRTFARYHDAGVPIEIHAGEWCGPESVWDALRFGFPGRIGHGVSVFADPMLVDAVREAGIHLEMCPTSNLKTGSIRSIEEHPIRQALERGISFSVNTDDPGVFSSSMDSEYALLRGVFGFADGDFERVFAYSLAARFRR
jgi:adenosine deaminase